MASTSRCPPWLKENPEQQGLVNESTEYSKLLITNVARLCTTVDLAGLWMYLIALDVIDTATEHDLESRGTNENQVRGLVEYLLKSPCWKLHGFVRALCMNDQDHVVSQILGFNPEDYSDVHQGQDVTGHHKRRKKDNPSRKLAYSMERCTIEVVGSSDELLQNPEKILAAGTLKVKPGEPRVRTAIVLGHPAVGKSMFIRCHVHKWCRTGDEQADWDLIVMLNISTLKLTAGESVQEHIKEAIRQSIEEGGVKEAIRRSLDDDSLDVLIMPGGVDDYRSEPILEMLKELISRCYRWKLGFNVLSTCRVGLSQIDESWFEESMKIDGFTREEGVRYVSEYCREIRKPADESVYSSIENSEGELDHILTDPLLTHILSIVTAHGTLKLTLGQKLLIKTLLKALERFITERPDEKNEAQEEKVLDKQELDQKHRFYNLSLYTLLNDVRIITQNHLDKFQISTDNPYLTFFNEEEIIIENDEEITQGWTYSHKMFHTYFSACALEVLPEDLCTAMLLTISSNEKFRNTQRILFTALGGNVSHSEKLSDMICVNLIAQGYFRELDRKLKFIYDIREKAKATIDLDALLNTLVPGEEDEMNVDTSKAKELQQRIQELYGSEAELLKTSGFLYQFETRDDGPLLTHVFNCLHEVPEEYQQLVFDQSLGRLLPSTSQSSSQRYLWYKTGGMRWSEVRGNTNNLTVYNYHSLTDAAEAVRQFGQQHLVALMKEEDAKQLGNITLNIGNSEPHKDDRWGDPTYDQFLSTALWSELLSDIADWSVTTKRFAVHFKRNLQMGVKGFLQCLQMESTQEALRRILGQEEGGWLRIDEVFHGEIDSASLLAWTDWYLQQDLIQVKLFWLTCHMTGEDAASRLEQQEKVHNLQLVEHNGDRLFKFSEIIEEERIARYLNDDNIGYWDRPSKRKRLTEDESGQH